MGEEFNPQEELEKIRALKEQNNQQNNTTEISGEDKAKAIVEVAKQPENIVRLAVSDKVANKIKNDENVIQRIDKTADNVVENAVATVENESEAGKSESEQNKLQTYFNEHKEELKTAGIDKPTYLEDMQRGVKWHRKWSKFHWALFGWWQTGLRTILQKAKPFRVWLNIMALLGCLVITSGAIWGIVELIRLIA